MILLTDILTAGLNIKVKFISKLSISFPPIAGEDAHILLLGSMPSVKSLEQQQYYAHPRNAFWPIMSELFGINKELKYEQRCENLIANQIALWDVLKVCKRQGSLDQHIESNSMVVNDFNTLFQQQQNIKQIFFNGSKAEQVFKKHVLSSLDKPFTQLSQIRLPSTSPAHASIKFDQKLLIWKHTLI